MRPRLRADSIRPLMLSLAMFIKLSLSIAMGSLGSEREENTQEKVLRVLVVMTQTIGLTAGVTQELNLSRAVRRFNVFQEVKVT